MQDFKIGKKEISIKKKPFIIGEVSANHKKSITNVFKAIDFASKNNFDAVKLQTFDAEDLTINTDKKEFLIKNYFSNKRWNNRSLFDLYKEAELPIKFHERIFKYAKNKKVICFSSVFSEDKIKFLEKFNVPAYKIASLECLHFPLIEKVSKTNKPLIISTGTLDKNEIFELVKFLNKLKNKKIIIMHCNTEYPVKVENVNLDRMNFIKSISNFHVGFSDHTTGFNSAIASVALGAVAVEKHIKMSKKTKTLDSDFSLSLSEMKIYSKNINEAWISIGDKNASQSKSEKFNKKFRRSIFFSKDVKKGEEIKIESLKIVRPKIGLSPKNVFKIIGKKAVKNFKKDSSVKQLSYFRK